MKLYEFQRAFERLVKYGDSVWEQGFEPDRECNVNALDYFAEWLEDHAAMFEDGEERLSDLKGVIEAITSEDIEETEPPS